MLKEVVENMNLDDILGIDQTHGLARRARRLVEADRRLIADLVSRRHELGLSQDEVARRMDTSQSVVARIESGARDMHQSTIRRYAMAVDATVEHRVVPDDAALERSSRIVVDFELKRPEVVWASPWTDNADSIKAWNVPHRRAKGSRLADA